jgi:uncharacterized protein YciI
MILNQAPSGGLSSPGPRYILAAERSRETAFMLYMCHGIDGPDGAARRDIARADHFEYLKTHRDKLVLGGATLADDDDTRLGSVLIINVPNRAAAEAFAEHEPLRKAGVFESYSVTRMRRGQWYPENAPKSAQGN